MTRLRTTVLALVMVLIGALLSASTAGSAAEPDERRLRHNTVFLLFNAQVTGSPEKAIVVGLDPINAKGKDVIISGRLDRFEFPDGNMVIRHKSDRASQHESFNAETCLFQFRERGTWRVVRGTGAYADASGRGTYVARGYGIACEDEAESLELFSSKVRAEGTLRY